MDKRSEECVRRDIESWFLTCLQCAPGRREFKRGRYLIHVIDRGTDLEPMRNEFVRRLSLHEVAGCLFVYNEQSLYKESSASSEDALRFLAAEFRVWGADVERDIGHAGHNLTQRLELLCPVTEEWVVFDDFDAIAFYPRATDETDPLYDPSMDAPYPCVNFTSDIFGFALFTRDMFVQLHGVPPRMMDRLDLRRETFGRAARAWQRLALRTVAGFAAHTNPALVCPMHTSADRTRWLAIHEDAAFGELEKALHSHEMPVLYTERVIAEWLRYFSGHRPIRMEGLAPKGARTTAA